MTAPREKRRLERYDLEIPAKVEVTDTGMEKGLHDLLTSNICSGGAYFHTSEPFPVGTEVRVDLALPLNRLKELIRDRQEVTIQVTGRVLRSEPTGMAIGFNRDYRFGPSRAGGTTRH